MNQVIQKYRRYLLILIFLIKGFAGFAWSTSSTSGNWNSGSSWQSGTVPVIGDGVTINSGNTITYNGDLSWPSQQIGINGKLIVNGNLTITSGAYLYLNTGGELVVTGNLIVSNDFSVSGLLTVGQNFTVNSTFTNQSGAYLKVSGNVTVANSFNNNSLADIDGSLTVTSGQLNANSGTLAIDGNLTMNNQVGAGGLLLVGGNYVNNGGPTYSNGGQFYVLGTKTCNSNPATCSNIKDNAQWVAGGSSGSQYISSSPSWWVDHLANIGEDAGTVSVCTTTTTPFSVPAVDDGNLSSNTFEWAAYGGTISGATNSSTISGHTASVKTITGGVVSGKSSISVTWDATSFTGAYVAVRQTSAAGCSDGLWSVIHVVFPVNTVINSQSTAAQTKCNGAAFDAISVTASGDNLNYQWYSNTSASNSGGTPISGAINSNYTPLSNSNGTLYYYCIVGGTCGTATSTVSGALIVNPSLPVSVSIAASPSGAICAGTSVTFTASPTNGGTTPTYIWKKGGVTIPSATGSTYSSTTLAQGDVITVEMTSNATCATGSPATSNSITMTVNPTSVAGSVTPVATQVCYNTSTTLTLAGSTGSIQWQQSVDGTNGWTNVAGGTGSTTSSYTTSNLITKTYYRAQLTSGVCPSVNSNVVEVSIDDVKPVFSNCPTTITHDIDAGFCSALVSWTAPTANDVCDGAIAVSVSLGSGGTFATGFDNKATITVGTTSVTYTATDSAGNTATCTFNIIVKDMTAPVISCPPAQTVFCADNIPNINTLPLFLAAGGSYTDNALNAGSQCNMVTVSYVDAQAGNTVTRTYTLMDGGNNTATGTQVFTISQPTVTIVSQNTTTCIGGTYSITSTVSPGGFGTLYYQWQKKVISSSTWSDISGANSNMYDGTLSTFNEEYRLLVSQNSDFGASACYAASAPLSFTDSQAPVFQNAYAPQNQTLCTSPGQTNASASYMKIDAIDVIDNCALNLTTGLKYAITGAGATSVPATGINLTDQVDFNIGTSTVTYVVTDAAGNTATHIITITVNAAPASIAIAYGTNGTQPNQCATYNYSVDGGVTDPNYTYSWNIYLGSNTVTPVTTGFTIANSGSASVTITFTGEMAAVTYTLEATKTGGNGCTSKASLAIALQNSFNLLVSDPGNDCKAENIGTKSFNWEVGRNCGTASYTFTYVIAEGEFNTLAEAQAHALAGTPVTITNTTDNPVIIPQTVVYSTTLNFYTSQTFTLFIYNQHDGNNQTDINATDDHQHFILKGIPNTSEISTN